MKVKLLGAALAVVAAGLLAFVIYAAIQKAHYEGQLLDLQNAVASRDQTIEVQQGVYDKLALEKKDLEDMLTSQSAEVLALKDELKKKKQELLTATQVAINWKKAYEAEVNAHQGEVVNPDGTKRAKVEFDKDFGYIGITGWTLTNPAQAWVSIKQNRPLKLTVAVTQDSSKVWHTYVTSSEENVQAEIELSSVNPFMLQPKWYEKLSVDAIVAAGSGNMGATGLVGAGVSIGINQFSVGPMVLVHIGASLDPLIGVSFAWRPFQK